MKLNKKIEKITKIIFPEIDIYSQNLTFLKKILFFLFLFWVFYFASKIIFADNYKGFDWINFWGINNVPLFYPPWTYLIIKLFNWHSLVAFTLTSILFASMLRAKNLISASMVLFSLPLLWTIYLGQLEGIAAFGILLLPWLTPLALVKPQVSIFAFAARKNFVIGLFIFLIFSVAIFGFWPIQTLSANSFYMEGRYQQDISLGLSGALLAIPLLWFSRGDMDMLMLAGSFMTPHLIPYNLLLVVPSIARLAPNKAFIAALLSWLPFSSNWLGPKGWWLGWLFIIYLWLALAIERYPILKKFFERK